MFSANLGLPYFSKNGFKKGILKQIYSICKVSVSILEFYSGGCFYKEMKFAKKMTAGQGLPFFCKQMFRKRYFETNSFAMQTVD